MVLTILKIRPSLVLCLFLKLPMNDVATETNLKTSPRQSIESSFTASDGQEIFYRYWEPKQSSRNAVMLFHRGHEHSARWQDFVDTSELNDCWFFAWDARGHGKTEGERGAAESFSRMVRDADDFARHICRVHGLQIDDVGVVAQSVGAVVAATWIHDYAPPIKAMVLATPALRIKLYVPLAIPGLRLWNKIRPGSFIKSYVRPGMLTHDKQQADDYANDPLVSPQIATNILLDLHGHLDPFGRRCCCNPHSYVDVRFRQGLCGTTRHSRKILRSIVLRR